MTRHRRTRVVAVARAVRRIKDGDTGINSQRKTAILAHLREHPEPIGRLDVADMFGIHETLASTLLTELVDEGLLRAFTTGRLRRYRLKEDE